ncbi:MAG: prephenate dehydrogenase/arogenate dehydrogenase family protein [Candidatus Diapherotrites archaeon]
MKPIIGIIGGKGKMGKLFARFFRFNGFKVMISDKKTKLTAKELMKKCNVIIFSTPMNKTEKAIEENAKYAKKGSLLLDLASLKEMPVNTMNKSASKGAEVIGLHPLFGPKIDSFRGKTIVLCPLKKKSKWLDWLKKLFKKNKIRLKIISAKKHDKLMSVIQGMNYFSILTERNALKKLGFTEKELQEFATPNYASKKKLTKKELIENKRLIQDILFMNSFNKESIKEFLKSGKKLQKIINSKNKKEFEKFLKGCA